MPSPAPLLDEDALKAWSGYSQRARLEEWLRERKIPYTRGQGGRICTTQAAIDAALMGRPAAAEPEIDFL